MGSQKFSQSLNSVIGPVTFLQSLTSSNIDRKPGSVSYTLTLTNHDAAACGDWLERAKRNDLVVLCADRVESIVDELQSRIRPS